MIRDAALAIIAGLGLAGCIHQPQCASLPTKTVAATNGEPIIVGIAYDRASVAALRCLSGRGDKEAQLALGERYEAGRGLKRDFRQAAHWYEAAARFVPGTTYVYAPPVGKHGRGQVLPVRTDVDHVGLPKAKYRLALLYLQGRGVKFSITKARELLEAAAKQGYAPARAKLDDMAATHKT